MAIEETKRKIHFTSFEPFINRKEKNELTVGMTNGSLRLTKALITELDLNGKFIKFYYDPQRKIVGFRIEEEIDQRVMKDWKIVKSNTTNGNWTVSIGKLLLNIPGGFSEKKYKNLPVKKYVEKDDAIGRGMTYYYFELDKLEEEVPELV